MAKNIQELLQKATELKEKQKSIRAEMREAKKVIATEFTQGLSEVDKQKQIKEAEKIIAEVKQKVQEYRNEYKQKINSLREKFTLAKNILQFVNYEQKALPKVKNQFLIEGKILTIKREGIPEIKIDITKANWQQTAKAELKKYGINGENRIADNIIYKASQIVKANQ